jgi:hypothetical protein
MSSPARVTVVIATRTAAKSCSARSPAHRAARTAAGHHGRQRLGWRQREAAARRRPSLRDGADLLDMPAAARTIGVHGAVIHGRWDSGRRSTVWCFDIERARAADLKDDLQAIWAGKLESVIWRPVGPAEVIRFS